MIDYEHKDVMGELFDAEPSTEPTILGTASGLTANLASTLDTSCSRRKIEVPERRKEPLEGIVRSQHAEVMEKLTEVAKNSNRIATALERLADKFA